MGKQGDSVENFIEEVFLKRNDKPGSTPSCSTMLYGLPIDDAFLFGVLAFPLYPVSRVGVPSPGVREGVKSNTSRDNNPLWVTLQSKGIFHGSVSSIIGTSLHQYQ